MGPRADNFSATTKPARAGTFAAVTVSHVVPFVVDADALPTDASSLCRLHRATVHVHSRCARRTAAHSHTREHIRTAICARAQTYKLVREQHAHALTHTRSRARYCACVARFTSSPEPRRRNRPGISLSLVLALSNVVRHRRQPENIITPTTTTTTTTYVLLIYYRNILFFFKHPNDNFISFTLESTANPTRSATKKKAFKNKKKTVKSPTFFKRRAKHNNITCLTGSCGTERWRRKPPNRCSPSRDTRVSSTSSMIQRRFGTVPAPETTRYCRLRRPPNGFGKKNRKRRSSGKCKTPRSNSTRTGSCRSSTCPETLAKRWVVCVCVCICGLHGNVVIR